MVWVVSFHDEFEFDELSEAGRLRQANNRRSLKTWLSEEFAGFDRQYDPYEIEPDPVTSGSDSTVA